MSWIVTDYQPDGAGGYEAFIVEDFDTGVRFVWDGEKGKYLRKRIPGWTKPLTS